MMDRNSKNILENNIRKQLALNTGQISVSGQAGSYGFVEQGTGRSLPGSTNASNYVQSSVPAIYQAGLRAEVYNYAKGVFGGREVPDELIESLASLATYYVSRTGVSVQTLFNQGQLQQQFLSAINTFLNKSIQFGYQTLATDQPWVNNPSLRGNIAAAYRLSLK
jgi:hypothetical protein